jgi:hypothetical protein
VRCRSSWEDQEGRVGDLAAPPHVQALIWSTLRRSLEAIDHESRAGCKERITYETFVKNLVEDDVSITDPMQVSSDVHGQCHSADQLILVPVACGFRTLPESSRKIKCRPRPGSSWTTNPKTLIQQVCALAQLAMNPSMTLMEPSSPACPA